MSKTVKLTARVNAKSPKYGYGFHSVDNGWRVDVPYHSITVFGKSSVKPTIRSNRSGLRWIVENNRSRLVRVAHNVAQGK